MFKNYRLYRTFFFMSIYCTLAVSQVFAKTESIAEKFDTSLPIEINADNLEIDQNKQTALFSGHVEAIQGEIIVRSDRMDVYYRTKPKNEEATNVENTAGAGTQSVSKVKVNGNVRIVTPHESARGKEGVYDVEKGVIELEGAVTLTQGENIIQGDKLVYNLKTGKSTVSSAMQKTGKDKGKKKSNNRVKSIFVPEKK